MTDITNRLDAMTDITNRLNALVERVEALRESFTVYTEFGPGPDTDCWSDYHECTRLLAIIEGLRPYWQGVVRTDGRGDPA